MTHEQPSPRALGDRSGERSASDDGYTYMHCTATHGADLDLRLSDEPRQLETFNEDAGIRGTVGDYDNICRECAIARWDDTDIELRGRVGNRTYHVSLNRVTGDFYYQRNQLDPYGNLFEVEALVDATCDKATQRQREQHRF
ncbi:MAG TPA: hypothetical protein VGM17_04365 [Rhizomicrobium sp.]